MARVEALLRELALPDSTSGPALASRSTSSRVRLNFGIR
jgi:hypothetical protein